MKCLKCGMKFSESDIEVMEEGAVSVCYLCAMRDVFFLMVHDGVEFAVQAFNEDEAIQN